MNEQFIIHGLNSYAITWLAVGMAGFIIASGVSLVVWTYHKVRRF